ncbi:MAG: bifunctional riboflavin kinase/FAD synthetase [Rhizobiaceae bacterium]
MSTFYHHQLNSPVSADQAGAVVAIGNFDGVHMGHQVVLDRARSLAAKNRTKCFALSFEPHPRTLFKPDSPVFRLTDEAMKARVLEAFGLDGMLVLEFTKELAATSAEGFVDEFLLARAKASHVVSGFNFHFGKKRTGSPEYLRQRGAESGFGVEIVEPVTDLSAESGELVSSSRVRRLLGSGDVAAAAKLLGYHWLVSGKVIKGAQLGRTLEFPTANIELPANCHLAHGIYTVRLRTADGEIHDGVASYGRRPTFDNGRASLETFIFDFNADIYGQNISVSLIEYIRGEEKFDTVEALVAQMHRDTSVARATLDKFKPFSLLDSTLTGNGSFKGDG